VEKSDLWETYYGKFLKIDSTFSFLARSELMGLLGISFSNHLLHDTKDLYHTFLNILIRRRKNNKAY
jgi:hypothetical protein